MLEDVARGVTTPKSMYPNFLFSEGFGHNKTKKKVTFKIDNIFKCDIFFIRNYKSLLNKINMSQIIIQFEKNYSTILQF